MSFSGFFFYGTSAHRDLLVRTHSFPTLRSSDLVENVNDVWRTIDLRMCEPLRYELDRCGGSDVAVDYQLITTSALLKDAAVRDALVADIETMPDRKSTRLNSSH